MEKDEFANETFRGPMMNEADKADSIDNEQNNSNSIQETDS